MRFATPAKSESEDIKDHMAATETKSTTRVQANTQDFKNQLTSR